jgi:segregation and condensation protein A
MSFRVDLETYRGPLDLLLYLVRKHEVEITEIPIAIITEQFLEYLDVLKQLDINLVGDFVDMASTLMEIKSRMLLPHVEEAEPAIEDPRQELVQRLLEYKQLKEAASMLEDRGRQWQDRFVRLADDTPQTEPNLAEQGIREVELWDLVSAFSRLVRDQNRSKPTSIVYDDTPIHVYVSRLQEELTARGTVPFTSLFQPGMHKSTLVGIFLAVLELVRHYGVRAIQKTLFGEIYLSPGELTAIAVAAT